MAKLAVLGGTPVAGNGLTCTWPEIGDEERKAVLRALDSRAWCRMGLADDVSEVTQFEHAWAEYHDAGHCLAVATGTAALVVAFRALGIGPGDEVVVPAVTFISTSDAVALCGAAPVFADMDPDTYQIDAAAVESAIRDRTRAICVVHYAGYPCDLDAISQVAARHGLPVVEDCAHAQGSAWRGRKVGAHITMGAFSFQQSKSLASGEGGAVITDCDELADKAWAAHNIGRVKDSPKYEHVLLGGNYRLGEISGALLRAQLKRLPEQTQRRSANADYLRQTLREMGGLEPLKADERVTQRGYYYFVLRYDPQQWGGAHRDVFFKALTAEGIESTRGYGIPIYKNPSYADSVVGHRVMPCPNAERACAHEQVTLITHHLLDRTNVELMLDAFAKLRENVDELRSVDA